MKKKDNILNISDSLPSKIQEGKTMHNKNIVTLSEYEIRKIEKNQEDSLQKMVEKYLILAQRNSKNED